MAGNDWLNGYLEAIIDTGEKVDGYRSSAEKEEKDVLTATKYFVNEVTGYDDAALYRTWIKASATKYPQEKGNRMEYLCWRIWHVARKKKKLAWEDAQFMAGLHIRKDLQEFNDSEDFSEGEKLESSSSSDPLPQSDATVVPLLINEDGPERHTEKRLYIVLISLHGLVRGEDMELGRDSDTGGQVKYVVELARALAMMPEVYRVDLLTRQISSPEVDWSYGEPTEMLSHGSYNEDGCEVGDSGGAYIVRIPCGPRDEYIRKELLWPHIQEFVDGALSHVLNMAKVLGDQLTEGESVWPHVIHGHYADAGDIASLLSGALNVPMVLTGHSLGRNKLEQLLKQGRQSAEDINSTYKIMRRLEAEELSLDAAELVITSTRQEIDEQWGLYDGFDSKMERILRARALRGVSCHGRFMPRMSVIPPGMDFKNVVVQDVGEIDGDFDSAACNGTYNGTDLSSPGSSRAPADPIIWSEIMRFFSNPHKPMILALARPDPKKNITTLLRAFGESRALRDLANLTLVMGNRDDIDAMTGGNASVLTTALKLIDKYDLYGQVAYPKHHTQADVPEIYRLAARTKGVFINPALVEPFGLTLIEAAAHGLPMVATKNGGPVDIHRTLNNGLLVDPHDQKSIADALLKLVAERKFWTECRQNGLKNIHLFSWPEHCRTYLSRIAMCRMRHPQWQNDNSLNGEVELESQGDSMRDVHDLLLRLSMDGDKLPRAASDLLKAVSTKRTENGDDVMDINTLKQILSKENERHSESSLENGSVDSKTSSSSNDDKGSVGIGSTLPSKVNTLRRRRRLVIIAVDSFDSCSGEPTEKLLQITKDIFKVFRSESSGRCTGFILSTSLTGPETLEFLSSGGISLDEFDALICASGSELFYPAPGSSINADAGAASLLCPDPDYKVHIDYRWGREGLRKTIPHVTGTNNEHSIWENKSERSLIEDIQRCNSHCFAYEVTNSSHAPSVDQLRQRLRRKGLRCHVMYCQRESKLHVIPLLASRSQALRYLFVRWGFDVANMFVFVGETGDTDYEELLAGTHKTIVLKGAVEGGSERLLRGPGGYTREDIAPAGSPNIVTTKDESINSILSALSILGLNL